MKRNRMMHKKSYIYGISFISALGGYLFGFDFAVITGGLPFLTDQFNLTATGEGGITASLAIGAMLGCAVSGWLTDKFGRKYMLVFAAMVFGFSSILMGMAPNLISFITGRFFAGIGVGMASMLSPLYISEISPGKIRGRLVSINQLTIVLGIGITHLVNYSLKDTGPDAWRWMFGLGVIPSILFFLGALFLPESPRWLAMKNHKAQAISVLKRIGGEEYARSSYLSIQESFSDQHKISINEIFGKTFRAILFIGIGLAVFQQWCGINVVFNYTARIFESIGANRDEQLIQAVYIGIINLIFTLIAMALVDRIGRKPLMLFGAGALAVLYFIIAWALHFNKGTALSVFVLLAIGSYAVSLAPVTWVLISEIFPNKIRGKALSIATLFLWFAYSILVFTFPILAENSGESTPFIIYAIICIAGFFFIKFKLKETKGKSLEEVEQDLTK